MKDFVRTMADLTFANQLQILGIDACWKACGTVWCFRGLHSCGFSVRCLGTNNVHYLREMVISLFSLLRVF